MSSIHTFDNKVKFKVSMLVLLATNASYNIARLSTYYKKINKNNQFLRKLLEDFIMDRLFKWSMYTVTESEFNHNSDPTTGVFQPKTGCSLSFSGM